MTPKYQSRFIAVPKNEVEEDTIATLYGKLPRRPNGEALLTQQFVDAVGELIKEGQTINNATRLCSVKRETVFAWLTKGRKDIADDLDSLEARLVWAIDRASGEAERKLVRAAMRAALNPMSDGTGAIKILERRNPDDWAPALPEGIDPAAQFTGMTKAQVAQEARRVLQAATKEVTAEAVIVKE